MSEILNWSIGALVLLVVIYCAADVFSAAIAEILAFAVRWVQRVLFGIGRPRAGPEALLGRQVFVHSAFVLEREAEVPEGYVAIDGVLWRARSVRQTEVFVPGEQLSVAGREGLVLLVYRSKGQQMPAQAT